jgi:asparagine synthase (glutamine-hydrolysing)
MERLFAPEVLDRMGDDDSSSEALGYLERAGGHWLSAARYMDIKSSLPLDILTKVDRMSMAHSLEAREPLLDHRLVEFAATIPPEMMLRGGTTKWIFKEAMRGILPDDIIDRRKQGFGVPLGRWFRGKLGGFVHDLLLTKRSRERGFFKPTAIENLVRRHEEGRPLDLQVWTLLSFELWCRAFIDARPARQREAACASL